MCNIYYISECNNFRAKNFYKLNKGLFCLCFNFLYYLGIFNYKRYVSSKLCPNGTTRNDITFIVLSISCE